MDETLRGLLDALVREAAHAQTLATRLRDDVHDGLKGAFVAESIQRVESAIWRAERALVDLKTYEVSQRR